MQEVAGLDAFFQRTGYPRAPRYYVIKWLTDWVREFGFDGYRVDTAKHFEPAVSAELKREAEVALADWRRRHPAPGPGQPAVLHGGRGLWLGAGPGQGLRLRRPDSGLLRQRLRRSHQLRLQERYRISRRALHPVLRDAASRGAPTESRSSTTSAPTTTARPTTRTARIRSAPAPASSSHQAAPRSTTETSWRARSGWQARKATPICARS